MHDGHHLFAVKLPAVSNSAALLNRMSPINLIDVRLNEVIDDGRRIL